ncbi:MAG: hypothetical protein EOM91_05520 [Sphingobacteriia bacterium]|nr:hypothetical protein [Sphingobacteriia bacterium]NCC38591.1 hypothetical protein [Gammaproteobacteria bacterium]
MWLNLLLLLVLALVFVPASLLLLGISRWSSATQSLRSRLEGARGTGLTTRYDPAELADLPPPVQAYLSAVLTPGQPIIAAVELRQEGEFALTPARGRWSRVVASQVVVTERAGFDWDARIGLGPGVKVFVHDAYIAGTGLLQAALIGLFPLAKVPSSAELSHAELMRFLAEAPLYPTKLLPSQGVRWEPIDAQAARATLADGDLSVSLRFDFADTGLIGSAQASGRYRAIDGKMVATPWEVRFADYQERGGMRIPLQAEVAWIPPEGRSPYWRGRVSDILYKFTA